MTTVGVRTGIDTRSVFATQSAPPHLILEGLPELLDLLRRADAGLHPGQSAEA